MRHESLASLLSQRFAAAIAGLTGGEAAATDPQIRPTNDPRFGDYQCNAALALARTLKAKPREIAQRIVAAVDAADLAEPLEIAGPGFINIRLSAGFLGEYLEQIGAPAGPSRGSKEDLCPTEGEGSAVRAWRETLADRVGIPATDAPVRVVIDYSSPNIAKQMHVGHLRSTIIGDALARVLEFEGHEVIRHNHVGDWGTQFGMLICWYEDHAIPSGESHEDVLAAVEDDYRAANERFKSDPDFAQQARLAVGQLQAGDEQARRVWRELVEISSAAFGDLYERLGVLLEASDVRGESAYNDLLAPAVAELREKLPPRDSDDRPVEPWAEVREDQGAVCIFFYEADGSATFKNADGDPLPMIIRKSDGAYLYSTTDLAAVRYRVQDLGARRVIYVVGSPTKLHLEMVFAAARLAGWAGEGVALEHVSFGQVLGSDRKLLRTRTGGTVKLRELLDEAERRALALLEEKQTDADETQRGALQEEEKRAIASRIGIGAVKYFDLARDRNADYVFNYEQMLALTGNTAPYMMYAYARIRSIYRKAAEQSGAPNVYAADAALTLHDAAERTLALRLARLGETIDVVAADLSPHVLCAYLYELAADFMRFYEACPVLRAPDAPTRLSRLRLCDLTARTLRLGLGLLGIEVIERM